MKTKYWILIALFVVLLLILYNKQEYVVVSDDMHGCRYNWDCPSGLKCNKDYQLCL